MARYAEVSDIQPRLTSKYGLILSVSSEPTQAQTEAWLDQASAMVNSALTRAGYTSIPATGANDVLAIRVEVVEFVTARVIDSAVASDTIASQWQAAQSHFHQFIEDLAKGQFVLIDQSPSSKASWGVKQAKIYGV